MLNKNSKNALSKSESLEKNMDSVLISAHDRPSEWQRKQRLHDLFDDRIRTFGFFGQRNAIAVDNGEDQLSYKELDKLGNKIARHLIKEGVKAGQRVALLCDKSFYLYATMVAISRLGASFVPLDASFPDERIDYILSDSEASHVVVSARFLTRIRNISRNVIAVDADVEQLERLSGRPLSSDITIPSDAECYVIYTSGSTGKPKGVRIMHSNICNFLLVARDEYGYLASDRVYQGLTPAFDYSFEEIWVPLLCGATLVPAPEDVNLLGEDLAEYIEDNKITALCSVPTILNTIERPLKCLRFLMVSGEGCPQDLADKWARKGLRFLNTYGPTETTVTATFSVLTPGKRVNIGVPLPTYSVFIANPDEAELTALGSVGEICVGGIGLAPEYLNLPRQSCEVFVKDFAGIPNNPSGKVYRTGDLGRINNEGEIECLGRKDSQVKIRGYRIEVEEIEAIARGMEPIGQVVVQAHEVEQGRSELVAYYTLQADSAEFDQSRLHATLRQNLPGYMVPAFFEELEVMPLLASGKIDRKKLPAPSGSRLLASGVEHQAAASDTEKLMARVLGKILKVEQVSTGAHFFDDMGANSLIMARFLSKVNKELKPVRITMKTLYQNPDIASLASQIDTIPKADPASVGTRSGDETFNSESSVTSAELKLIRNTRQPAAKRAPVRLPARDAGRFEYFKCGALQCLFLVAAIVLTTAILTMGYHYVNGAATWLDAYRRSAIFGLTAFIGGVGILIAVKWLAIGRFDTKPIALWSVAYVRFWIAKTVIRWNPMNMFIGSPLYNLYLRALGAKIGRDSLILARAPVCTDLFSVGCGTIVRQDVFFTGYSVENGYVYPGRIAIGDRSFIGEACTLEINASVGDDAQLGTSSALLEGGSVPSGCRFQGVPARHTDTQFRSVETADSPPRLAAIVYSIGQLLGLALISGPLPFFIVYLLVSGVLVPFSNPNWIGSQGLLLNSLTIATLLYFGGIVAALIFVIAVPRCINLFLQPDKTHRVYGFQYYLTRLMTRCSNSLQLNTIFGDSSMIVYYLSAIGYDLRDSTQTGSNFGVNQRHHSPFLCKFNRNTLVSDGLVMMNMEASNTSFRLSRVNIAADNYLGNLLHWPADSKVGENCLIATKAMVPIDGAVRENVGILGSPPFEIPRSVARDAKFDHFKQPETLRKRLRMKLASNLVTLAFYSLRNVTLLALIMVLGSILMRATEWIGIGGLAATVLSLSILSVIAFAVAPLYSITFERFVLHFYPLKPLYVSLYDRKFWNHERFWKLNYNAFLAPFNGTPLKAVLLRLQGAKVGKQVFDDGASITEPALVEIGDYCTLNYSSSLQSHSLEDGTFKSDRIIVRPRCTIGLRAFVHYGCTVAEGANLAADSFVMKGTHINEGELWQGNPARAVEDFLSVDLDKKTTCEQNSVFLADSELLTVKA